MDERYDEAEIRRFLLGDSTPEETARVEERLLADQDYHDALMGMHDEILVERTRGVLDRADAVRLDAQLAASPARRRALDEMRVFLKALDAEAGPSKGLLSPMWVRAGLAAAGIAAALLLWVNIRSTPTVPTPSTVTSPTPVPPATDAVFTVTLAPTTPRTESVPQANLFRIPAQARAVNLLLTVPIVPVSNAEATIRRVGTDMVLARERAMVQPSAEGVQISLELPATVLQPGDYVVAVTTPGAAGRQEIASRFFSVVE